MRRQRKRQPAGGDAAGGENIADIVQMLNRSVHRIRQDAIDEALFDVISGCEASSGSSESVRRQALR